MNSLACIPLDAWYGHEHCTAHAMSASIDRHTLMSRHTPWIFALAESCVPCLQQRVQVRQFVMHHVGAEVPSDQVLCVCQYSPEFGTGHVHQRIWSTAVITKMYEVSSHSRLKWERIDSTCMCTRHQPKHSVWVYVYICEAADQKGKAERVH